MSYVSIDHTDSSRGNLKYYLIGFSVSIILTIIPFIMVMNRLATKNIIITVLITCAIAQILVHLFCFLHLNGSSEERWNILALVFTVLIIMILVTGSLWIMWYLDSLLMCN